VRGVAPGAATVTATVDGSADTAVVQVDSARLAFAQLAAGRDHTCGLSLDGVALCWGRGSVGQLGDGAGVQRVTPTPVAGDRVYARIAAGQDFTCAVTAAGAAFCWGANAYGQLGDNTNTARRSPTAMAMAPAFVQIVAGDAHACGRTAVGAVYCWGRGGAGQLGTGTTAQSRTPSLVQGGNVFASIAAGGDRTCGLTAAGAALCWGNDAGRNSSGRAVNASVPTPVPDAGTLAFAELAVGRGHACGRTSAGVAYCWGTENQYGQLGDGTTTAHLTPVRVGGDLRFATLAGGGQFSCGLTTAGAAYCWGRNNLGQLGNGVSASRLLPTPVNGELTLARLAAGSEHACGWTTSGAAYCWGDNGNRQLGSGLSESVRAVPTPVSGSE
jgi:alpha-tubulin suppressor-like RCC1 family protein